MKRERIPLAERLRDREGAVSVRDLPAVRLSLDEYMDAVAQLTGNEKYRELFFAYDKRYRGLDFRLCQFVGWAQDLPEDERNRILNAFLVSPFAAIHMTESEEEGE